MANKTEKKPTEESSIVIDEMRVVTPGTQALLGFQFSAFFANGFEKLAVVLKYIHLLSLCAVAIATMLLMCPVAFHQIAEAGKHTRKFHKFAGAMTLIAMVFLALGLALDMYVVSIYTTRQHILSLTLAILLLTIFYGSWFGLTIAKRNLSAKQ
jgi:hypothetical protein